MKQINSFLLIIILCIVGIWFLYDDKGTGVTPEEAWQKTVDLKQRLGLTVLDVDESHAWIEKHKDEISIPSHIQYGEPHFVSEIAFLRYSIEIAADPKGHLRVIARKLPPDKVPLKIGDKLPHSFPVNVNIEWEGNSISEFQRFLKNKTYDFAFEANKTYDYTDLDGSRTTYVSLDGATIHYKADRIVTNIDGSVFKRYHAF